MLVKDDPAPVQSGDPNDGGPLAQQDAQPTQDAMALATEASPMATEPQSLESCPSPQTGGEGGTASPAAAGSACRQV